MPAPTTAIAGAACSERNGPQVTAVDLIKLAPRADRIGFGKQFFQLPSLAAAYRETGDEAYPQAARDYLADWILALSELQPRLPPEQVLDGDRVLLTSHDHAPC